MAKSASYSNLMSRKMRRTILRSPLQFLTMTLILALASTLFSGLYASHLAFKGQIDEIYATGNMADISTTLTYDYNNEDYDPLEPNKDYQLINNVVSDAGRVEAQYHASAKIHGLEANVSINDTYPTINKPSEIYNDKSTSENNYFYFCENYLRVEMNYGKRETWIDDDNNYQPVEVRLDIANLKNRIEKNANLKQALENVKKEGKINILDDDYLTMMVTPTGHMQHPENIASNITQPFTFITTREFLKTPLNITLSDNYDIALLKQRAGEAGPLQEAYQECLKIIGADEGKTVLDSEIMTKYWGNNRCLTRLNNRNDAVTYREKIEAAFKSKSKNNLLFNVDLEDTVAHQQLITDMLQSVQLCYVFPPVFFLVAILIVLTTISQIILKERKEIGTLKAIGASNRSILTYYMGLTGIISLIGVAIGLIVGPLLIPTILDAKYDLLYNLPKVSYVFPTTVAIIMTLSVLIITMLVAFLIARKEAKALPVTSMRPKPVNIKKKNLSEDNKEENTHKLCFKMATRNIFCSASRSIMVIIGVLGCTALLCCGFGIDDSVQRGIDNDTRMFFNTDSLIYFSNPTVELITDTIPNLKDDDGTPMIEAFEPYAYLPVTASRAGVIEKTFSTYVYGIPYNMEKNYKFFDLGYLPRNDEIVISNQIAKKLNIHEGDPINYEFLGKTRGGIVTKVIDVFYMHGIYIDGTYPFAPDDPPLINQYPTCGYARFNKALSKEKVMNKLKNLGGVASVTDHAALMKQVSNISSSIGYITITIKVFAILLAVVALYNLALLNFKENIRNIATMKVLGFNRREVAESLFFEVIILSAIGALIGLTLGYPLTLLTLSINQVPMCEFFYYVSVLSFVLSLIITIGVTAIINIFVGLRSKQVKMVESLKSIE